MALKFCGTDVSLPGFGSVTITAWSISVGKEPEEAAMLKIFTNLGGEEGRKCLIVFSGKAIHAKGVCA